MGKQTEHHGEHAAYDEHGEQRASEPSHSGMSRGQWMAGVVVGAVLLHWLSQRLEKRHVGELRELACSLGQRALRWTGQVAAAWTDQTQCSVPIFIPMSSDGTS